MKNKILLTILFAAGLAVLGLSAFKNAGETGTTTTVTALADGLSVVTMPDGKWRVFEPHGAILRAYTLPDGTAHVNTTEGQHTLNADGSDEYVATGSIYYEKTWAQDTITDAENDTLVTTGSMNVMYSDFEYNYSIIRTNISGTTNVALKVEQTNYTSGNTAWATLATGSATTATIEYLIGDCTAVRTRYIVDGTGTQSSSYRLRLVLKKKT